ncbi:MAG TPA: aspartoacylase [Cyanothece sp. UBA12306]|nr:aspartoacylase [Cyanothece sp. UBA12306]
MVEKIKNIALVGGTHGNEMTGVYLIKKFKSYPHLIERSSLDIKTFLANSKAIEAKQRYIETDLNRCFGKKNLEDGNTVLYEQILAKNIARKIKDNNTDLIVDLHTTTSQMGLTIIICDGHPFHLQLGSYLTSINPKIKILKYSSAQEDLLLRSITKLGFAVEVGAVAQGVLDAGLFQETEQLVYSILDALDKHNQGDNFDSYKSLILYQVIERIDYPRDGKEIRAMVHPNLQFKDYQPLNPGDPLFLTFEGKTISYEGDFTVYPVFINEAAYYEKGIAMCFTEKQEIVIKNN